MVISEECFAEIYYYDKDKGLLLCDPPHDPDIVLIYLLDKFSGYRDLVEKINTIFKEKKLKGNPIALTLINGFYYALCKRDVSDVDMNKDINKIKAAIYQVWKMRNPNANPLEFDDIFC